MTTRQEQLQGRRVKINETSNPFGSAHVGKSGTVVGHAPTGFVAVDLDDGTKNYWASTYNLSEIKQ
jgi:hypothetical protein